MKSGKSESHAVNDTRLHILIPANNPDVNLCKTLLTSNALGYPDPTMLAWQEKYDTGKSIPEWVVMQECGSRHIDRLLARRRQSFGQDQCRAGMA
jgi:hypothetical protein